MAGTLPWTSPPVVRAWQEFGQIANTPGQVRGGTEAELLTSYGQAGQPLFGSPPGCYLDHEGSFITAFYTQDKLGSGAHPRQGTDFRFIPFPALAAAGQGTEEVAGDLLGMFRDTTAARELIAYRLRQRAHFLRGNIVGEVGGAAHGVAHGVADTGFERDDFCAG